MGLDFLDIAFRFEKIFGLRVSAEIFTVNGPDGRVRGCTVGELQERLIERLAERQTRAISIRNELNQKLPVALADHVGSAAWQLSDETVLEELISPLTRVAAWQSIGKSFGVTLPALHRPPWVQPVMLILIPIVPVCFAAALKFETIRVAANIAGMAVISLIARILMLTSWQKIHIPVSCRTVGNLLDHLLTYRFAALQSRHGCWDDDDIRSVVVGVLVEIIGVDPRDVVPSARLVEDLGLQ